MNNRWPGTVEWSSQKTYNQSVLKARWSSAGQTHKGSKGIGTCQSSLPCQASTACLPAGKMEQNGEVVTLGSLETEKKSLCHQKIFENSWYCFKVFHLHWPGWCWVWSGPPAGHGPTHLVHSTTCAMPEGKLWATCCCLLPVLTQGRLQ